MKHPKIVSAAEWQAERDALLVAEKEATRTLDALAAQRRRLPMVEFPTAFTFDTPAGKKSFLDLFDGRPQLVVYQFMDRGPDKYCPGCTKVGNNIPATSLPALAEADITWLTISNMPLAQITAYAKEKGWTFPFISSHGNGFTDATGAGNMFQLDVFLRDGDKVYRTYSTTRRGVDRMLFQQNVLDFAPYGRQEDWEDSPEGWPQHPTYG